jgi:phosphodiester glycosidase
MTPAAQARQARLDRRRRLRRRLRYRRVAALVVVGLLTPVVYSYITTMAKPSSLPLSIRTVEWIRANRGAWLVDTVEHYWYSWNTPAPGGPALKKLPAVGVQIAAPARGGGKVRRARPPYRPPRIVPLLHPALPLEGVWQATGKEVKGEPPVLVTTFRPDPTYPRAVAYVAWIDHSRTQLALYPGRYEPPGASPRGPMEVPVDQRWRLLATFNSGFTYGDGHGGFGVNGQTPTPLRQGTGTVVAFRDGRVDVVDWRGGSRLPAWLVLARQNLPLIVDHGRPSPELADPNAFWGYTLGNAVRVWRSGIGIDRRGNLIYAAADLQTASTLARLFIRAGAVRAMELDINPEWPSFITYSSPGGRDPIKLVPNDQQSSGRYLVPDDRDFFAVYRRTRAATVPFR